MQGAPEVIEFLNEALTAELTAINQYFAASKIADNWGYGRLASQYHEESIEEMATPRSSSSASCCSTRCPICSASGP